MLRSCQLRPRDFLSVARRLVPPKSKPSQASLKRALSSTYYAVFHHLARTGADLMVRGEGADRSTPAWVQIYRSLDHHHVKGQCKNNKVITKFPKQVEDFASVFITLQEKRHDADYDPTSRYTKSEVLQDIASAEAAIRAFDAVPSKDRRAFCAWVLFKTR